jgi:putative membrane protein
MNTDASPVMPPGWAASKRALVVMLALVLPALVVSGIEPYDRLTWALEVFPIVIVVPLLLVTFRRFPLTTLLYSLIGLHALILVLGGHYTYARVPLGFWLQDLFEFSRNHYDRIGHLAQGFIPAIAVREILIRTSPLKSGRWLPFITVALCLAVSATYEFLEWWTAIAAGVAAENFLATQGDVWDTQWDMLLATCGAVLALLLLARSHDRALTRLFGR